MHSTVKKERERNKSIQKIINGIDYRLAGPRSFDENPQTYLAFQSRTPLEHTHEYVSNIVCAIFCSLSMDGKALKALIIFFPGVVHSWRHVFLLSHSLGAFQQQQKQKKNKCVFSLE